MIRPFRVARSLLLVPLLLAPAGCAALGAVAYKLSPPPTIDAKYTGLAGQKVAVMVWADRAIGIDWPDLAGDVGKGFQAKLQKSINDDKPKDLKGATFPYLAESVVRYQEEHPDARGEPATEVAPKLPGITRLVYIEIDDFMTRSDSADALYHGHIHGSIRVVEIDPKTHAGKLAYTDDEVKADYPKKSPPEGVADLGDSQTYSGVLDEFTTELQHRVEAWINYEDYPDEQ